MNNNEKNTENKETGAETAKKEKLSFRTIFYHNPFVLLFSFICAVVIWFSMAAGNTNERPRQIYDVPITITLSDAAQEEGIRIFSQSYSTADVAITGSSYVVNSVTAEGLAVTANFSPDSTKLSGNTTQTATLDLNAEKQGNDFADYQVASVNPKEINVIYDRYKESTFDIANNISYTAASDYYPVTPTLSEKTVVISGPESAVNRIARVSLDYEISDAISQTTNFSSGLTLYDENDNVIDAANNYLTLSVEKVDVSIPVLSKQTAKVEVTTLGMPEGFSTSRISIDPETVDIAGDAEAISRYQTITLPTALDFSSVNVENNTITAEIPMPTGVRNVSGVEEATVTVNLNGFTESNIALTTFNLSNVPENKTVTVVTKSLTVDVVGSTAQLQRLSAASLYATVDMASYSDKNGNIEVPVTIGISGSTSCWAYGQYTVQVSVTDKAVEAESTEAASD